MKRLTTEEFIRRAREVHGDKYNYDKSEYIGYDQPIIITCKHHGDFLQRPNDHFHGAGCGKCALEKAQWEICRTNAKIWKTTKPRYVFDKG